MEITIYVLVFVITILVMDRIGNPGTRRFFLWSWFHALRTRRFKNLIQQAYLDDQINLAQRTYLLKQLQ